MIQKGLAVLAMLAAFTIAADGYCWRDWNVLNGVRYQLTISENNLCVRMEYDDGNIERNCDNVPVYGPCNRHYNGPHREFVICAHRGGGLGLCIDSTRGNVIFPLTCYCPDPALEMKKIESDAVHQKYYNGRNQPYEG